MKLSLLGLAIAACTTGVLAQTPGATAERITVVGCLDRAQRNGSLGGTVVGTSAAPNTADDEANSGVMVDAFLLHEAHRVTGDQVDARPSTGAVGTSGRETMATFGLKGREAELERHQGARLQVTGTVMPPVTSGRGSGGAATAAGSQRLQVESFKVLAERCVSQP
ncbi:MAG: hypothetical protein JSU08_10325 [Acidobacteria bacterium]|nr:hypothetical protein [Acidobacteriota bacterium]